jgi:hypothetical protein
MNKDARFFLLVFCLILAQTAISAIFWACDHFGLIHN